MSTVGTDDWSQSGSAEELKGIIDEWRSEGRRGSNLLVAVQEMITEQFLNSLSPRSCKLLRRFLANYDVPIDVRAGYPNYKAILDLIRGDLVQQSIPAVAAQADASVSHALSYPGGEQTLFADTQNPGTGAFGALTTPPEALNEDVITESSGQTATQGQAQATKTLPVLPHPTSWTAPPQEYVQCQLQADTVRDSMAIPTGSPASRVTANLQDMRNRNTRMQYHGRDEQNTTMNGTSRAVVDLVKAYSSEKKKFSGEDPEQSLRMVRRSYFSTCKLMNVRPEDACKAAYLTLTSSALEYYYEYIEDRATNAEDVFRMLQARFQTRTVQERALSQWQTLSFANQRSSADQSDHDTLQSLYIKAKKLHRCLPEAYSDDLHLRDFLLRACLDEPFCSRIPEKPAETSADALAQLSSAITRYTAYKSRINRAKNHFPSRSVATTNFADDAQDSEHGDTAEAAHYVTKPASTLQGRKENRLDKSGKQMLCHHCSSKYHLLSACPTASSQQKINYLSHLEEETDTTDSSNRDAEVCLTSSCIVSTTESQDSPLSDAAIYDVLLQHIETAKTSGGSLRTARTSVHIKSGYLGVCVDTGASSSVGGLRQYQQYLQSTIVPVSQRVLGPSNRRFRFGSVSVPSIGTAHIRMPCQRISEGVSDTCEPLTFQFQVNIVDLDIPILLGLDVLSEHQATVDVSAGKLRTPLWEADIETRQGHMFVTPAHGTVLFSEAELVSLHKRLAHPSAAKMTSFIERARPKEMSPETRTMIADLCRSCAICSRFGPPPRRVRSSIPSGEIRFNLEVSLDIFFIDTSPVLHVICRGTRFNATSFLPDKSSSTVWQTFLSIWVYAYLGPPYELLVDQGTEVTSDYFRGQCKALGIHLAVAPVESHSSLGLVERMHGPIRRVYHKLVAGVPATHRPPRELLLATATKAVNDTTGPSGLVPTLLVFGVLPNVILDSSQRDSSFPTQSDRLAYMSVARSEAESIAAQTRLKEVESRALPTGDFEFSPGDQVQVFREKGGWQGPATFLDRVGNSVLLNVLGRKVVFVATNIKPYSPASPVSALELEPETTLQESADEPDTDSAEPDGIFVTEIVRNPKDPRFQDAIEEELKGLLEREVFTTIDSAEVPPGSNILGSKFHLVVKDADSAHPRYKARLVVLGHLDRQKQFIESEAPTVAQMSIRLLLSLAAIKSWPVWSRDIRQAFLQSDSPLSRRLFVRPPRQLSQRFPNKLFDMKKPLYGTVDAPSYWFHTYVPAYKSSPTCMKQSFRDECFLYAMRILTTPVRRNSQDKCSSQTTASSGRPLLGVEQPQLDGLAGVLVDDSLLTGSAQFAKEECEMHARFEHTRSAPESSTFTYAGGHITQDNGSIKFSQHSYVLALSPPVLATWNFEAMRAYRGQLAWLACVTRPDLSATVAQLAQVCTSADAAELTSAYHRVVRAVTFLQQTSNVGLLFRPLVGALRIVCYSDASFGGNSDHTSQLGGLVLILDAALRAHVVTWFSKKSPRVTSSVLTAETLAFHMTADIGYAMRMELANMGCAMELDQLTDSKQLYSTLRSHSCVREKRLMIDVAALREMHRRGDITRVGFVRSEYNLADGLTKDVTLDASRGITRLLADGQLRLIVEEYIDAATEVATTSGFCYPPQVTG